MLEAFVEVDAEAMSNAAPRSAAKQSRPLLPYPKV